MRMRGRSAAALAAAALTFAFAPVSRAAAQVTPKDSTVRTTGDSALEARTSAVAAQLRCPVCQGLSIQDSPSELAQSMRSLVRDQLAQGKSPEQVKAYFVSKYGEWILLSPAPHGFNLLAYLFPVLVVVGGGALIVLAVRRWTAGGEASS